MFERGFKAWCERIAIQNRQNLGLKPQAPLDPYVLAKKLDILVWKPEEIPGLNKQDLSLLTNHDSDSWSAITIIENGQSAIIVNSAHSQMRRSSDVAHELAHILIGHNASRVDVTEDGLLMLSNFDKKQEEEAVWLCGCLLLPREALIHVKKQRMDDDTARSTYMVSQAMLTYRMRVSGVDAQFRRLGRRF